MEKLQVGDAVVYIGGTEKEEAEGVIVASCQDQDDIGPSFLVEWNNRENESSWHSDNELAEA